MLQQTCEARIDNVKGQSVPSAQDIAGFRQCLQKGASALFNAATGLPLQSSPVCTTLMFSLYMFFVIIVSESFVYMHHHFWCNICLICLFSGSSIIHYHGSCSEYLFTVSYSLLNIFICKISHLCCPHLQSHCAVL